MRQLDIGWWCLIKGYQSLRPFPEQNIIITVLLRTFVYIMMFQSIPPLRLQELAFDANVPNSKSGKLVNGVRSIASWRKPDQQQNYGGWASPFNQDSSCMHSAYHLSHRQEHKVWHKKRCVIRSGLAAMHTTFSGFEDLLVALDLLLYCRTMLQAWALRGSSNVFIACFGLSIRIPVNMSTVYFQCTRVSRAQYSCIFLHYHAGVLVSPSDSQTQCN